MDYKVFAKAISLQLESVLADMVHPEKTRHQEKAFNWIDHAYLLSTLWVFTFGPQFVGFLQVLYASTECLLRLNWTLTAPVSFRQGVSQGYPLSGQLYTLAIEPFLNLLRTRLTGMVLREPEMWLVLSAYADDMFLMVQDLGDLVRTEACQAIYLVAEWLQRWSGLLWCFSLWGKALVLHQTETSPKGVGIAFFCTTKPNNR
ncbi:unnamed protein product [Caretta caretta]